MKTKISVDLFNDESLVLTICDLVAKHNAGKIEADKELFKSLVKLEKIKYSSSNKHLAFTESEDLLYITNTEDKIPFMSLTWKEVTELNETELSHIHSLTDKIN